jgi:hypothetical protein
MIYTDGLTEARSRGEMFGIEAEVAYGGLTDDLCLLAARVEYAVPRLLLRQSELLR